MLAKAGEGELRTVRTKLRGSQDRSVGICRMHSFGICRGIFCGSELHGIRSGSRRVTLGARISHTPIGAHMCVTHTAEGAPHRRAQLGTGQGATVHSCARVCGRL